MSITEGTSIYAGVDVEERKIHAEMMNASKESECAATTKLGQWCQCSRIP